MAYQSRTPDTPAPTDGLILFSNCSRAELSRIGSLTTKVEVARGKVLVEEGRPGQEFFIIVEGRAAVSRHGLWLADLDAGTFFGELALLENGYRTATVIAETDMTLLVFSRAEFNSLHEAAPTVGRKMLAEMGGRLLRTNDLLDEALPSGSFGVGSGAGVEDAEGVGAGSWLR
jgi:CRP/FNR family transcriptional regulator, cyclic AMP receptor protein